MEFPLLFLSIILLVVGFLLLLTACRQKQELFKPLTHRKGTDQPSSPPFGMRAAADTFDQARPRRCGRRRDRAVCFVTGTARTTCGCTDCQGGDR